MASYVVGGTTAALLGLIEQHNRLRAQATFRHGWAWAWWLARFTLDFAVGLAAIASPHLFGIEPVSGVVGAVLVGAAGSAVARSRVLDYEKDGSPLPIGPTFVYDAGRRPIERELEDICAARQAAWVHEVLLPGLERQGVTPPDLGKQLKEYVSRLERLGVVRRRRERDWIDEVLKDSKQGVQAQREALVEKAMELEGYRILKHILDR